MDAVTSSGGGDRGDCHGQAQYLWRLEWGPTGARRAAERGDVVVIVDTLSFSSSIATAVARGAIVIPCAPEEDSAALAARVGGVAAVRRRDAPRLGPYSLSPLSFLGAGDGQRIVVPSVNGAVCSRLCDKAPHLLAGALLNAGVTARAASAAAAGTDRAITVIACGERWAPRSSAETAEALDESRIDGLRFAIEDYLGAGAILSRGSGSRSPEASLCAAAFESVRERLDELLWDCGSGRELRDLGFEEDVRHACRLDLYDAAAMMRDGGFERWTLLDRGRDSCRRGRDLG